MALVSRSGFLHPTMRVLLEIIPLLNQGAGATSATLVFHLAGSALALEVHRQHVFDDGVFPITLGYFLDGKRKNFHHRYVKQRAWSHCAIGVDVEGDGCRATTIKDKLTVLAQVVLSSE